jgi:hypothetical protein
MLGTRRPSSSWIKRDTKNKDLLYVSNIGNDTVSLYSFPEGVLEGIIDLPESAYGLCTDRSGNIFLADSFDGVMEYSHGGTQPIRILADNGDADGCSIDRSSGDLAVTNLCDGPPGSCFGGGTVLIYKKQFGAPRTVHDIYGGYMRYCAFSDSGTLVVDGSTRFYHMTFAELAPGSSEFQQLKLRIPGHPESPGFIQWVSDELFVAPANAADIYGYKLRDRTAKEVEALSLEGMTNGQGTNQYLFKGSILIAPNMSSPKYPYGSVDLYRAARGGVPTRRISGSMNFPEAVALSLAK